MSDEVLAHHLEHHGCDADTFTLRCPCSRTVAVVCEACGTVLFCASREWCAHAQALWEAWR
jgi:hypothetical protein